jgi:hypothetical protein
MRTEAADDPDLAIAAEQTLQPVQARQGVTLGHMRYVLAISLALAVAAFVVIYFISY